MTRAERLLTRAVATGAIITTAESCTAGMIAAAITDPPGASAVFDRGFVTYSNAAKTEMLGVSTETLAAHGAVSEQTAAAMARGALDRSEATVAVAVTGIAGPGGSETKPEGRVCFAVAMQTSLRTEQLDFGALGRAGVRAATRDHALDLLLDALGADFADRPQGDHSRA